MLRVHGFMWDGTIKKTEQDIKVWCGYIRINIANSGVLWYGRYKTFSVSYKPMTCLTSAALFAIEDASGSVVNL